MICCTVLLLLVTIVIYNHTVVVEVDRRRRPGGAGELVAPEYDGSTVANFGSVCSCTSGLHHCRGLSYE